MAETTIAGQPEPTAKPKAYPVIKYRVLKHTISLPNSAVNPKGKDIAPGTIVTDDELRHHGERYLSLGLIEEINEPAK